MRILPCIVVIGSWLVALASFVSAIDTTHSAQLSDAEQYQLYRNQFSKSHATLAEEEQKRFNIFQENLHSINSFNKRSGETYQQGLNRFSDLTLDEFSRKLLYQNQSRIQGDRLDSKINWLRFADDYEPPPSVDYSDGSSRRVGLVRNQGDCASGWAIATTGLLEGIEIRNGTYQVIPLSVQNILDCDQYDDGCSGGDVGWALKAIQDEGGLNTEETYPYEASDSNGCRYNKYDPFVTTMYIKSIANLTSGDEGMLQKTVANYGPVAVGLDASLGSFKNYKSGVYYDSQCKSDTINHHMLVVGYGTSEDGLDYWKLKNSWSTHWGMSGYMLLARDKNNHCGIATKATVVHISN